MLAGHTEIRKPAISRIYIINVMKLGKRLSSYRFSDYPMPYVLIPSSNQVIISGAAGVELILPEVQFLRGTLSNFTIHWTKSSDIIVANKTVEPKYKRTVNQNSTGLFESPLKINKLRR